MEDHHDHGKRSQKNIRTAFLLNFGFTVIEIIGGLLTNSMAIISDALHDFGDSLSLGLAWYLDRYAKKGPDEKYSFGYARFSLLSALVNSIVLVGGSVLVLTRAIPRLFNPETVNPKGMLVLAILGILFNGFAVIKLKKGHSLNEKVVSWHLMEDVFGWIVVFLISILLLFFDIPILDPILSILITIYILFNVLKNLKEILSVLMQGVPERLSVNEIEKEIRTVENLLAVHHTHIWTLEGERHILSTHVVLQDDLGQEEIIAVKQAIRERMHGKGIDHVTIETEYHSEECKNQSCD